MGFPSVCSDTPTESGNRRWGEPEGDGKRFLFAVPVEQTAPQPFTVVLNWQAELKK